tara:strand:- start:2953 stop:3450 length:498 start_codon:yes stop_codon:yes gene_type:complete
MNSLIKFNIDTLNKILKLINPLEKVWINKGKSINNETIGRHIRHIIDFYLCFIKYENSDLINYDARTRNKKIETNFFYAKEKIDDILKYLKSYDYKTHEVKVRINYSITGYDLESSLDRELMHLADHTIHHANLIQIFIKNKFPNMNSNIEFYSPSTIDSIRCVQ